jgi:hypothetical protein
MAVRDDDAASHPVVSSQSIPAQKPATPGDNPERAVRAQTFEFNFWLRRWLRYVAWWAKKTGGEPRWLWWFWPPRKYGRKGFKEYFTNNAPDFGETIYKRIEAHISSPLKKQLEDFIERPDEPYLIIRGVFSRRFLQASVARRFLQASLGGKPEDGPTKPEDDPQVKEFLDEGCYDLVASALIAATKTELRRKLDTDTPYRNYLTEVSAEINQFVDGKDMHLRYRTATPELPPAEVGPNTAARVIVFACIENPIADPIYLIRAKDVIGEISDDEKDRLRGPNFNIFDKWISPNIDMQPGPGGNKSILHHGKGTDWLSFDPNRVCPAKITPIFNLTMGLLLKSIEKVAVTRARKIVLRRGDVLIVDNYRALTRRQERGYAFVKPQWMRRRPPIRWLRVYYGFPPFSLTSPPPG